MRKRERENPCGVCGHYHKYEEGEVCGICGHRIPASSDRTEALASVFPSEILKDFLFLGSYDNASRGELLKSLGMSRILNTVPACQNLYKNSFTYHCLQEGKNLQFDDAIQFLEQCEKDKARVLVHCMSGKSRSPAIVIAYLMKSRGWRLPQSYQWVKERRPEVELSTAVHEQLLEFEKSIFGAGDPAPTRAPPPPDATSAVSPFGFFCPPVVEAASTALPHFRQPTGMSIFDRVGGNGLAPNSFIFGAEKEIDQNGPEAPMDSS